jgi:hypothetical protein
MKYSVTDIITCMADRYLPYPGEDIFELLVRQCRIAMGEPVENLEEAALHAAHALVEAEPELPLEAQNAWVDIYGALFHLLTLTPQTTNMRIFYAEVLSKLPYVLAIRNDTLKDVSDVAEAEVLVAKAVTVYDAEECIGIYIALFQLVHLSPQSSFAEHFNKVLMQLPKAMLKANLVL